MFLSTIIDFPTSFPWDRLIAMVGLLVAFAAAYWAWKAVWVPKLVVAADDAGIVRTGVSELIRITDGTKQEIIDSGKHVGFITDLVPKWVDNQKSALPLRLTIFVENRGRKIAKRATMYMQTTGIGYRVVIEGGRKSKSLPAASYVRRPLDPKSIQSKEIGDIPPGIKSPVTLAFHFEPRRNVEAAYGFPEHSSLGPVVFHDYYLSHEDAKAIGKILWANLILD